MRTLAHLARSARTLPAPPETGETCEMCSATVGHGHDHLVDMQGRRLCCVCRPCALLFERPAASIGRYQRVPDRVLVGDPPGVPTSEWSALGVPVSVSFVFFNSLANSWIAVFPSPAGAVEGEPQVGAMEALAQVTPLVSAVRPDVEALLAHGQRGRDTVELYIVPVSAGYELVAKIRAHWQGFDGGDLARQQIRQYMDRLRSRSRPLTTKAEEAP